MGRVTKETVEHIRGGDVNVTITSRDMGLEAHLDLLNNFDDNTALSVGVQFPDRTYNDGQTVDTVARVHEFGAPAANIPQRSFIRETMERMGVRYANVYTRTLLRALMAGQKISAKSIWLQLGPIVGKDMKRSVKEQNLIDTGLLLRSVGWRVVKS